MRLFIKIGGALSIILVQLICFLILGPFISYAYIFGDDSREDPACSGLRYSARSVARFTHTTVQGATAFLISPQNHVLTVAHAVPETSPGSGLTQAFFGTLTFNLQVQTCGGNLATVTNIPISWSDVVRDANGDPVMNRALDYVLFQIPSPYDPAIGDGLGWLRLDPDTRLTQLEDDDKWLHIIAYSLAEDGLGTSFDDNCFIADPKVECTYIEEKLGYTSPDDACIENECDIVASNSGAPTFLTTPYGHLYGYPVVAIVGGGRKADNWFADIFVNEYNQNVKIRKIYADIQQRTNGVLTGIYDDTDGDSMPDSRDNCPQVPNTGECTGGLVGSIHCISNRDCDTSFGANDGTCEGSQLDTNNDGLGDACSTLPLDAFEPNNIPAQATNLLPGNYDLTIHDRYDTDFYRIAVPTPTDYFRISASYERRNRELAKTLKYKDCDTCPTVLAAGEIIYTNSGWAYEERGNLPEGRTYELEVYEWEERGPLSYELHVNFGEEQLPPDIYESNDSPETATEFTGDGKCIFSGSLNVHNAADTDYYKIEALGESAKAEISFDSSLGDLRLFLCDENLACAEASTSSISGTIKTLSISGCGATPSYVRVQGEPNFYDICLRTVALEVGCPDYVPWTTFTGSGAFDYRIVNQFSPGHIDYHGDVRPTLFVQLTDETASDYIWTLQGWVDYQPGLGQLFRGTLTIPKGAVSGSTVPFEVHMPQMLAAGLREWYQIEGECTAGNESIFNCNADSQCDSSFGTGDGVCTPFQAGSAQFQGPGNAITSFSAATIVDGLYWHIFRAGDRGTLVLEGGIDTDGDGILDDIEVATGTNPSSDDTDNDGIPDGIEDADRDGQVDYLTGETDPRLWDTDGDGVSDGVESGLISPNANDTDPNTFEADQDPATTTDPTRPDTDGDGLSDGVEDADQNGRVDPGETSPLVRDVTGPDLIVESLTHTPVDPTTLDTINFTAVVKNVGITPAGPSTLNFRIGGETFGQDFPIPALAPDESFSVQRQLMLGIAQNYLNRATADANNDVTESNEINNMTSDSYTVTRAGDLDGDNDVDMEDVNTFRAALGTQEGDDNYNPDADFDGDGRITMNDYRILRSLYTGGS